MRAPEKCFVDILRGVQFPDQLLLKHAWTRTDGMGRESLPEANTELMVDRRDDEEGGYHRVHPASALCPTRGAK